MADIWLNVLKQLKNNFSTEHSAALLILFLSEQVDNVIYKVLKKYDVRNITDDRLVKCLSVESALWIKFTEFYLPNYSKVIIEYSNLIFGMMDNYHLQYFKKVSRVQLYFNALLLYEYELGIGNFDAENTSFELEDLFLYKSFCEEIIPMKIDILINKNPLTT